MPFKRIEEAESWMVEFAKDLRDERNAAGDPGLLLLFNHSLVVVRSEDDAGVMVYPDAFVLADKEYNDGWYYVFTEHYGYHAFSKNGTEVTQYTERKVPTPEEFRLALNRVDHGVTA